MFQQFYVTLPLLVFSFSILYKRTKIVLHEINNYFNNDNNACTNQNLIGHRDLFRRVIAKEWVVSNQKHIDFRSYDKAIVKM